MLRLDNKAHELTEKPFGLYKEGKDNEVIIPKLFKEKEPAL
jgi:hypothetical protein